jgi:hypothetical protein
MTFLAQVMTGDLAMEGIPGVLSVFMCQNEPGMCDEWDPRAGGNQALLLPLAGLLPAAVPGGSVTRLGEVSAVEYVTADTGCGQARQPWAGREGRLMSDAPGQLGGSLGGVVGYLAEVSGS